MVETRWEPLSLDEPLRGCTLDLDGMRSDQRHNMREWRLLDLERTRGEEKFMYELALGLL